MIAPRAVVSRVALLFALAGALALAAFVVLTLLARRAWVADVVASFRWQIGWCGVAIAAALALLRRPALALIALLLALLELAPLLSLSFTADRKSSTAAGAPEIRLATANLLYMNRDVAGFETWVARERPDVLSLQEIDRSWMPVVERLAAAYPHRIVFPTSAAAWKDEPFGLGLFSRLPIESSRAIALEPSTLPVLEIVVLAGGRRITVRDVHPLNPSRPWRWRARNALFDRLGELEWGPTSVLAGDLNASLGSPALADLVERTGLRTARLGFGRLPTWKTTWKTGRLWVDLDHVLVGDAIEVLDVWTSVLPGSDHRALVARLR